MASTKSLQAPSSKKGLKLDAALTPIMELCALYNKEFVLLASQANELELQINELRASQMPAIIKTVDRVKKVHAELSDVIAENGASFVKPKTHVFHGITVGIRKLVSKLTFKDDAKTIALIQQKLPDQFDVLVETSRSIRKDAVSALSADDLRKIGGSVVDADDQVVIKYAQSDLSKFIKSLLQDGQK
jgi:hypothetical protein